MDKEGVNAKTVFLNCRGRLHGWVGEVANFPRVGVDKKVGVDQMMMTAHHRPLTNEISYSLGKSCDFSHVTFSSILQRNSM